jgi:DNA adenine methylase
LFEHGKSITSRWYLETLKRRIWAIEQVKHKINFNEGDAFEICEHNAGNKNTVCFIDAPYIRAGGSFIVIRSLITKLYLI